MAYPKWQGDWDLVKAGDTAERDKAVVFYAGLAEAVSRKLYRTLPYHVERDDIIQFGFLGLMRAVDDYRRPDHAATHDGRNVDFETYLVPKVRGMIYDELRKIDWAPRSVRRKNKLLDRAAEQLEATHGRPATNKELADALGVTVGDVLSARHDSMKSAVVSLDDSSPWGDEGDPAKEPKTEDTGESDMSLLAHALVSYMMSMAAQDRAIIALYYFENMKMADIGKVLGVPETKVSSAHKRISLEIRSFLVDRLET